MRKRIILLALAGVLVSGCVASDKESENQPVDNQTNLNTIPIVVDDGTKKDEYLIRLTSPQRDQVVKSPFLVGGEADLPDDTVYVRVKKPNGDIVISEQTRIKEGAFGVLLSFMFQATESGTVEVYGINPETKKEVALQSVEVNFDTISSGSIQTPIQ